MTPRGDVHPLPRSSPGTPGIGKSGRVDADLHPAGPADEDRRCSVRPGRRNPMNGYRAGPARTPLLNLVGGIPTSYGGVRPIWGSRGAPMAATRSSSRRATSSPPWSWRRSPIASPWTARRVDPGHPPGARGHPRACAASTRHRAGPLRAEEVRGTGLTAILGATLPAVIGRRPAHLFSAGSASASPKVQSAGWNPTVVPSTPTTPPTSTSPPWPCRVVLRGQLLGPARGRRPRTGRRDRDRRRLRQRCGHLRADRGRVGVHHRFPRRYVHLRTCSPSSRRPAARRSSSVRTRSPRCQWPPYGSPSLVRLPFLTALSLPSGTGLGCRTSRRPR